MKKNMATAMAAAMAFGAVVPAFAAEAEVEATTVTVDSALANGEITAEVNYDVAYETKFTASKADDVLREGFTVLEDLGSDKLYVAIKVTKSNFDKLAETYTTQLASYEDFTEFEEAAKDASIDKKEYDAEVKDLLNKTYYDKVSGQRKARYRMKETTTTFEAGSGKTSKTVALTDLSGADVHYTFVYENVAIAKTSDVTPVTIATFTDAKDDSDAAQYKAYSKKIFDLENRKNVTIAYKEADRTTLHIEVYKNDANKTHIETYEVKGYNFYKGYKFTKVAGQGADFAKHWAEQFIFDAMYNGAIDNTVSFRPDAQITRAEFAKMLVNTLDVEKSSTEINKQKNPFKDLKEGSWEYNYVMSLYLDGVVEGDGDGTFRPNAPISRQEAAKMIATLAEKEKVSTITGETFVEKTGAHVDVRDQLSFRDKKKVAVWADESVLSLSDKNVINGYEDNTFRPENSITRAESIKMMDVLGKLNVK